MKFSCIIPAYNEWPRIAKVLETVLACDELDEVIVVNDGSTDETREVMESFDHPKLTKIHQENTGKAGAIIKWIETSKGNYIVMIDSDLLNLKPEHITSLLQPIEENKADVTLSIRENSLPIYKWIGTDFVSGERVVPREIFNDSGYYTSWPGFGLEVKMNEKILEKGYRVKNIFFPWVITPRKTYKMGYIQGAISDFRMVRDILSILSIWRIFRQIWFFSRASRG